MTGGQPYASVLELLLRRLAMPGPGSGSARVPALPPKLEAREPAGLGAMPPPSRGRGMPRLTGEAVGVLPSTGRPMLLNEDGSISTERSITVTDPRLNDGRPTNIPSIWNGQELDEDAAVEEALKTGRPWQAYGSIDEAVKAAIERSGGLGSEVDAAKAGEGLGAPVGTPVPRRRPEPDWRTLLVEDEEPEPIDGGALLRALGASQRGLRW